DGTKINTAGDARGFGFFASPAQNPLLGQRTPNRRAHHTMKMTVLLQFDLHWARLTPGQSGTPRRPGSFFQSPKNPGRRGVPLCPGVKHRKLHHYRVLSRAAVHKPEAGCALYGFGVCDVNHAALVGWSAAGSFSSRNWRSRA